jgi:carboxymethylenebutenolidase
LSDLRQYLVDEYVAEYVQGRVSRREALRLIAAATGSMALATTALAGCSAPSSQPAPAAQTAPTAAPPAATTPATGAAAASPTAAAAAVVGTPGNLEIEDSRVEFPGQDATLIGYLTRPKGSATSPVVLVCHENQGLTDHIKDVTRRVARAGFVGLAVDLLSRQGGTDKITDRAQIAAAFGRSANQDQFVQDFQAGLRYTQNQPFVRRDRVGMTGFCFGGGVVWLVATKTPELKAAVPYYGPIPPIEDVPGIQAPVLAFYGANDNFINPGIPTIEDAMKKNNKVFEKVIYPGAGHAFNNDTNPQSYNAEAAKDAWAKMLAWFDKYLRA